MPAIGKITLDIKDYDKALNRARQQGQKFAAGSQQDFQQVGNGASRAGKILAGISAESGFYFGKLGNIIGAIASGPVVALTAALGALVALGADLWDRMTLSAEEYAKKLDLAAQAAEKNRAAVEQQSAEDAGYMDRLRELADKEQLSNEAKAEAATLIKNLSARYGDLGLSIDEVTGKIIGMDAAQAKFIRKQRENRAYALAEEIGALKSKSDNKLKQAQGAGYWTRAAMTEEERAQIDQVYSAPLEKQLQYAQTMFDRSNTDADMNKWQEVIDLLEKRIRLERELQRLMDTGAATEKEQAAGLKKKSDATQKPVDAEIAARNQIEKRTEDYYSSTISNLEKQLEIQNLINAGKLEEAERQKIINDLERQGIAADARVNTIMALQKQNAAAKLTQAQSQQAASLYDRALRAAGRGQEADTRAAIRQAEERKGGKLTDEERARTLELLKLSQQLDKLTGLNGFGIMAIQTNNLTARGGFQTGAAAPDVDKYNRIIAENGKTMLSVVQRIETICRQFGNF